MKLTFKCALTDREPQVKVRQEPTIIQLSDRVFNQFPRRNSLNAGESQRVAQCARLEDEFATHDLANLVLLDSEDRWADVNRTYRLACNGNLDE